MFCGRGGCPLHHIHAAAPLARLHYLMPSCIAYPLLDPRRVVLISRSCVPMLLLIGVPGDQEDDVPGAQAAALHALHPGRQHRRLRQLPDRGRRAGDPGVRLVGRPPQPQGLRRVRRPLPGPSNTDASPCRVTTTVADGWERLFGWRVQRQVVSQIKAKNPQVPIIIYINKVRRQPSAPPPSSSCCRASTRSSFCPWLSWCRAVPSWSAWRRSVWTWCLWTGP